MGDESRWTKDISELGGGLVKGILDDSATNKAFEVVAVYAAKEKATADEVIEMLSVVNVNYEKRLVLKLGALDKIAGYCKKYGLAQILEALLKQVPQLKCLFEKDDKSEDEDNDNMEGEVITEECSSSDGR